MSEISHDANFYFPIRELENDRVKLTPFIRENKNQTSQHAELFFQGSAAYPELYQFLPFGPFSSAEEYTKELIQGRIAPNPGMVLYAIIDKTRSPSPDASPSPTDFAGTIGYLNASPLNLSTEIGFIIVLPPFQRTHVTTNAFGLLLQYALDSPSASTPGLGLRRVQWQANEVNSVSINLAERMGLRKEGVLRWERVVPGGRGKSGNSLALREDDPKPETLGRHTVILAICWDDWEAGGRVRVLRLMDQRA
ncbi:acyl-CoA N-acyltransferase [Phlebopus sp. FC_14]|nr:acyl-CoA N-acyltransferase [Phlebopus sp. FC_14]